MTNQIIGTFSVNDYEAICEKLSPGLVRAEPAPDGVQGVLAVFSKGKLFTSQLDSYAFKNNWTINLNEFYLKNRVQCFVALATPVLGGYINLLIKSKTDNTVYTVTSVHQGAVKAINEKGHTRSLAMMDFMPLSQNEILEYYRELPTSKVEGAVKSVGKGILGENNIRIDLTKGGIIEGGTATDRSRMANPETVISGKDPLLIYNKIKNEDKKDIFDKVSKEISEVLERNFGKTFGCTEFNFEARKDADEPGNVGIFNLTANYVNYSKT